MSIVCLGGGVGATRLWRALAESVGQTSLTIVVNTADDLWHYGLRVCPDLDTVVYGLADRQDTQRGWGLRNETFTAMDALRRLGEDVWFSLGDQDLATHLLRTDRLRSGANLTEVTAELAAANGVSARVLPMTDQDVATQVRARSGGWVPFQEFHVKHRSALPIEEVRYFGIDRAAPSAAVLAAIGHASLVIIGPSSPGASVLPMLGLTGLKDAVERSAAPVIAVTPVVTNVPLVDQGEMHRAACRKALLAALGSEHSAAAVAEIYRGLIDAFVLDEADADQLPLCAGTGVRTILAPTLVHRDPGAAPLLISTLLDAFELPVSR